MRVAILHSEATRRQRAAEAVAAGALYEGRHRGQAYRWLKGHYAYLGPSGARHWLWRLAVPHTMVDESWLHASSVDDEIDALVIPDASALEDASLARLTEMAERGRVWLIVGGSTNLPDTLLGVVKSPTRWSRDPLAVRVGTRLLPVAGAGSPVTSGRPRAGIQTLDDLRLLDAETGPLDMPAVVRHRRVVWIVAPVFEFLGELLQGHADWWPLRAHIGDGADFYLDTLCTTIAGWLARAGAGAVLSLRVPPWGPHDHAVVLRHDTDDSSDPALWEVERAAGVPATWAVLADHRAAGWVERLRDTPALEVALHYRSNRDGVTERLRQRLTGRIPRADRAAVADAGLVRQVRETRGQLGPVATLHRHYHYVAYPELILALDHLAREEAGIVGAGSFSRFEVTRWGGEETTTIAHPHVGVPFWFPIRPVVTTVDDHRIVDVWESAAFIEPDEVQLGRLHAHAQAVPHGCYTLVFHPAHARGSRFAPAGTLARFREALARFDASWWIATSAAVFTRARRWSRLAVRRSRAGLELYNGGDEPLEQVTVWSASGALTMDKLDGGRALPIAATVAS